MTFSTSPCALVIDAEPIAAPAEIIQRQKEARLRLMGEVKPKQVRGLIPEPVKIPAFPMIRDIVQRVATHYGMEPMDIISRRKQPKVVTARHVAMYLARKLTPRSLPEIGRHLGNFDHTSVLNGVRRIEERRLDDVRLRGDVDFLTTELSFERRPLSQAAKVALALRLRDQNLAKEREKQKCKLWTDAERAKIFQLCKTTTQRNISELYGVSLGAIKGVLRRKHLNISSEANDEAR